MTLVTGATGLVGGAIVLELLQRRPEEVVNCLIRGERLDEATKRLHASLRKAAALYDLVLCDSALEERCVAVLGDITEPACGVDVDGLSEVAEMWHCAASSKLSEIERDEIEAHNIGGVANALTLAERLGVVSYNHVSTAYVAGSRTGRIAEEPGGANLDAENICHETKARAEAIVESTNFDVIRILRPSLVVAHQHTGRCASNTGIYGFFDQLQQFKERVDRRLGDYLVHRHVALIADPEARLNMIPIDVVATAMGKLSEREAPTGIYHLASLDPPTLSETLDVLTDVLGMRKPRYVEREQQLNSIDAALSRNIACHRAYMLADKEFDCTNTLRFCDPDLLTTALRTMELARFARAHLESAGERSRSSEQPAGALMKASLSRKAIA